MCIIFIINRNKKQKNIFFLVKNQKKLKKSFSFRAKLKK